MAEVNEALLQKMVDMIVNFQKCLKQFEDTKDAPDFVGVEGTNVKVASVDLLLEILEKQLAEQGVQIEIKKDLQLEKRVQITLDELAKKIVKERLIPIRLPGKIKKGKGKKNA
jgi:NAD-dependent SIR2 family protein deacetylase